jgi:hypothetical protein
MDRFLHIGFTWSGVPKTAELEPLFDALSKDWLRYSPTSWIVWTDRPASDFLYALKPKMGAEDLVLIVGISMSDRNGWQPKWIWEWIDRKRQLGPPPEPAPPPRDWARGLLGLAADPNPKPSSGLLSGLGGLGQARGGILGEHLDPSDDQKKR